MNSRYTLGQILTILAVSQLFVGCVSNQSVVTDITSSPPVQASSRIDSDEGEDICEVIAQDLSEGDGESLYERLDVNSIMNRILATFDKDKFSSTEYLNFKEQLQELIHNRVTLINDELRWDMVRAHVDGERYLCLVRTSLFGNGVSYIEYELRNVDGRLRVIDWYDLVREIKVTDMFIELFHDIYEMADAHIMAMPYQRRSIIEEQNQYFGFISALGRENPTQILNAFDKLPIRFKSKPLYNLILLNSAMKLDEAYYYHVLRNIAQRFGGDNRYAFLLIDLYLLDHEYEKVSQAIYSFKRQVGADPLLELLLAEVENRRGNKKAFYGYCLKVLNENPNYLDTYWYLFDQLVVDRHYDEAVVVLNVLTKSFKYTIYNDVLESDDKYRDFSKSSAFRAWKIGSK
jgi:hypothetical protein